MTAEHDVHRSRNGTDHLGDQQIRTPRRVFAAGAELATASPSINASAEHRQRLEALRSSLALLTATGGR